MPPSRRRAALAASLLWIAECFAASSGAWVVSYDPTFWRDWRTDRRLSGLDEELRILTEAARGGTGSRDASG